MNAAGGATRLESALLRDRLWVAAGLVVAIGLAWAWLVPAALDMYGDMDGLSAWMMVAHWDARYFLLIFAMWAVMMTGMMLPSAAPTLLLFGRPESITRGVIPNGSKDESVVVLTVVSPWARIASTRPSGPRTRRMLVHAPSKAPEVTS